MPIYNYNCLSCQAEVEILVRSGETPQCPQCGSKKLVKRLSVPARHHTQTQGCAGSDAHCEHRHSGGCCHGGGCCCGK